MNTGTIIMTNILQLPEYIWENETIQGSDRAYLQLYKQIPRFGVVFDCRWKYQIKLSASKERMHVDSWRNGRIQIDF
jgi:hypothetical protein